MNGILVIYQSPGISRAKRFSPAIRHGVNRIASVFPFLISNVSPEKLQTQAGRSIARTESKPVRIFPFISVISKEISTEFPHT